MAATLSGQAARCEADHTPHAVCLGGRLAAVRGRLEASRHVDWAWGEPAIWLPTSPPAAAAAALAGGSRSLHLLEPACGELQAASCAACAWLASC